MLDKKLQSVGANAPSILISYAHEDSEQIKKLEKRIADAGIQYFLDRHDIEVGEDIIEKIRKGIEECTHLLVYISPASLRSQWVLCEIGMAWGLRRNLIAYLDHPSLDVPPIMRNLKHLSNLRELTSYLQRLTALANDELVARMSPVERASKDMLYYYPGGYVDAIRLFGADDEYVTEARIEIQYTHERFITPPDLAAIKERWLMKKQQDTQQRGAVFFNGPNTRLIRWRATPKDNAEVALEQKILELELGPVDWYDYEGLNEAFGQVLSEDSIVREYNHYIGLDKLLMEGDVRASRLSNILDTGTTIVSKDGFVAYQKRSQKVSAMPGVLTSAVAENINRFLDDTEPRNSHCIFNTIADIATDRRLRDESYQPQGIPHPFATVRRGVAEELSPELLPHINHLNLKLLGLSFDLGALHPDVIFIICINLTKDEILNICMTYPGKDWSEGKICFTKADFRDKETMQILGERWIAAGKASMVRAIEFVNAVQRKLQAGFDEVFAFITTMP